MNEAKLKQWCRNLFVSVYNVSVSPHKLHAKINSILSTQNLVFLDCHSSRITKRTSQNVTVCVQALTDAGTGVGGTTRHSAWTT